MTGRPNPTRYPPAWKEPKAISPDAEAKLASYTALFLNQYNLQWGRLQPLYWLELGYCTLSYIIKDDTGQIKFGIWAIFSTAIFILLAHNVQDWRIKITYMKTMASLGLDPNEGARPKQWPSWIPPSDISSTIALYVFIVVLNAFVPALLPHIVEAPGSPPVLVTDCPSGAQQGKGPKVAADGKISGDKQGQQPARQPSAANPCRGPIHDDPGGQKNDAPPHLTWLTLWSVLGIGVGAACSVAAGRIGAGTVGARVAKVAVSGAGAALISLGALSGIKDLTVFKDSSLVKGASFKTDSLVHLDMRTERQPVGAAPPARLDLQCPGDWLVKDFGVGWSRHLGDEKGDPAKEPSGYGLSLRAEVEEVATRIKSKGFKADDQLLLVGSTDELGYHQKPLHYNADLAVDRAKTVQALMVTLRTEIVPTTDATRILVLNQQIAGGIARPILGPGEKTLGRAVVVCRLRRAPGAAGGKPGEPVTAQPTADFNKGGLVGFVFGAVLMAGLAIGLGLTFSHLKQANGADRKENDPEPDRGNHAGTRRDKSDADANSLNRDQT